MFETSSNKYSKAKAELYSIERKSEMQKRMQKVNIFNLSEERKEKKRKLRSYSRKKLPVLNVQIEQKKEEIKAAKQKKEILSKKIDVSAKNKAVDDEATILIHTIQNFFFDLRTRRRKHWKKDCKKN